MMMTLCPFTNMFFTIFLREITTFLSKTILSKTMSNVIVVINSRGYNELLNIVYPTYRIYYSLGPIDVKKLYLKLYLRVLILLLGALRFGTC